MVRPIALLATLVTAAPAAAGLPGEDKTIISGHVLATHDAEARDPLGLGAEVRVAFPFDLELRGALIHTRLPPREIEAFMLEDAQGPGAPDRIAFSQWESRLLAAWSYKATEREAGLRVRAGALGILSGSAGATTKLDPIGWTPDYTFALRAGPSVALGFATPLKDTPTSALLDMRLGASLGIPLTAAGGRVGRGGEDREFALTVDDQTFGVAGLVGRESRVWVEGTFTYKRLVLSAEFGLEHNARSSVRMARAQSPNWNVADIPERVAPHAVLQVGFIF